MVVVGTVESIALEHWDLAQDVNVRASYLVTHLTADIVERVERAAKEGHGIPLGRVAVSRSQRAFGGFPLPG